MNMRNKLLALVLIPLVFLSALIIGGAMIELHHFGEIDLNSSRTTLINAEKEKIQQVVEAAFSTISDLYLSENSHSDQAIAEALKRVKQFKYGHDGYLFGYSTNGIRIFSGDSDKGIGDSYLSLQDSDGIYLIKEALLPKSD